MTDVLAATRDRTALIRSEAPATEAGGQLTPAVVDAMRDAGVFRMTMSRALGGPELSPLEQLDVLEELAFADGSAGWCGMINSDGGYVTAFLDPAVAKEMYPSLDLPTSVIGNPSGRSRIDGDGFWVSGQWGFASGSPHCKWFFLNCLVFDGEAMKQGNDAMPLMRVAAVPAEHVEILDTWHTTGLNGTSSHDVKVEGAYVPGERTFSLFDDIAIDPSPLYQWRWMFFANLAAVPLGIARAALEGAIEVAGTKLIMPTFTLARDEPTVQIDTGRATALVRSARAYVYDTIGTLWDSLQSGRLPTQSEWADVRLATTYAAHACKDAVDLLYSTLGTTGVYRKSPLDRQLRDSTTLAQHMLVQTKTYAPGGRCMLGLDAAALGF